MSFLHRFPAPSLAPFPGGGKFFLIDETDPFLSWSHPDIALLSDEELREEMTKLEDGLTDVIGKIPTYMRPPFFSWSDENLETLGDMGYRVIHADVDTLDWELDYDAAKANFDAGIDTGGSIVLAHDVHENTAGILVPYMIQGLKERGLRST